MITDSATFLATRAVLELVEMRPRPKVAGRRTYRTTGLKNLAARLGSLTRDVLVRRPATGMGELLENEP
jgi:hypothetical protein